jgi:hypothetical protein
MTMVSDDVSDRQDRDENDEANGAEDETPRMRFKGIVESEGRTAVEGSPGGLIYISPNERRWNAMSRQIWQMARLTAVFVFFSIVIGLPLGNWFAHRHLTNLSGMDRPWNPLAAFEI